MRIALYEDRHAPDFCPLTLVRPVFELICGHFSLRERLLRQLPVTAFGVLIRESLAEVYREEQPDAQVNRLGWLEEERTVLINGRWLPDPAAWSLIEAGNTVGVLDGTVVFLTLEPDEVPLLRSMEVDDLLENLARQGQGEGSGRRFVAATGKLLKRPWDLVEHNSHQIRYDFAARGFVSLSKDQPLGEGVACVGPRELIYIDPAAKIEPYVVIDASRGPVSIEAGAAIQAFTRLEGPCHIGAESQLFRANVRGGTTLGPVCRTGGEIEATILHGYVNKYHDGFLGHSYVCPWVNLGALTTNSDLKNDYSQVRIPLSGEGVDSGLTKVGCFIGDHTKTGLGSLINTGSSIGVMCLVLPLDGLLPKFIPSFAGVWFGALAEGLSLDRNLTAARAAMSRRNCELTAGQERLYRFLHQMTRSEREQAITLFQQKQLRQPSNSR